MTLLELAEKVERAEENDVELFEDTFRECFPKPPRIWITDNTGDWTPEYSEWNRRQWAFYEFLEAEAFLDAAMSLVSETKRWLLTTRFASYHAEVDWNGFADAATPALALVAASLRARAIEEQSK